jgi:hypothetical protein
MTRPHAAHLQSLICAIYYRPKERSSDQERFTLSRPGSPAIGRASGSSRFLGVVAIDGLPAESWPEILTSLDLMPLTHRWASFFIFRASD